MRFEMAIRYFRYVMLIVAVLICGYYVYNSVRMGMRQYDFQYNPVRILLNGENPYLYSLNHIKFNGWQVDANQVPSCLALLVPFAFLPRDVANNVWALSNVGFTVMFLFYVYGLFFSDGKVRTVYFMIMSFLLITGHPWRVLVGNGQHLMFSLAFFMAAYYYSSKGQHLIGGIMLALSAFKYTTIAPLGLMFICNRWWKSIGVAVCIHLVLTLCVSLWINESPFVLIQQSFVVSSALIGQGSADVVSALVQTGFSVPIWCVNLSYLFYAFICVFICFSNGNELIKMASFAVVANVMFYHRGYDFVVLVLPTVCLLRVCALKKEMVYILLFLLATFVMVFGFNAAKTYLLIMHPPQSNWVSTVLQHLLLFVLLAVNYTPLLRIDDGSIVNTAKVV